MDSEFLVDRNNSYLVFIHHLIEVARSHWLTLLITPIVVGLTVYIVLSTRPQIYRSTAYLRIDRSTASSAKTLMTSPKISDQILEGLNLGKTSEAHSRYIDSHVQFSDTEPNGERNAQRIFHLNVTDTDPKRAKAIAERAITAWIQTTVPGPEEQKILRAEIDRHKTVIDSMSKLIQKLQSEATALLFPNSLTGEIASPIYSLIARHSESIANVSALERRLNGMSRDVIIAAPSLPQEPLPTRRTFVSVATAALSPLLLALLLLSWRYLSTVWRAGTSSQVSAYRPSRAA